MKLAISSYSFNRFGQQVEGPECPPLTDMIRAAADYGVSGIELLGVQFESTERSYLNDLKYTALKNGIEICAVSAHHNFVNPDPEERRRQMEIVTKWVDVAAYLGAGVVRVFGGRWGTIPDFDAYMAAGGKEPPLEGYTDEQALGWVIEAFQMCTYYAEQHGVVLGLENHWGFTGDAEGTRRILEGVGSPWLRVILDTGNFLTDAEAQRAALAPYAVMVHAKTYVGGGIYYTLEIDYRQVRELLERVGFRGYISLEFEGKAHPDEGIPQSLAMLREAFGPALRG
ncbi:MAG: sugar phosphate isomerase/epimerase [Chloroflexi bacterium]|nr:sugar phosphate isomerase/epimerase [Chloroflexota bacterium]